MNTTAIILVAISAVVLSDILIALYFRSKADRIESGEATSSNIDPEGARKTATLLLISAPVLWLIVALICFGVIPSGLAPIQF
jgi:hypothetical protein